MLTALADGLVGVDDSVTSADGEVLRIGREAHQQQVTGRPIGQRDALQAWLRIQRLLELAIGWGAAIAGHIEMPDPNLTRDMDRNACAVQAEAEQSPLVAKRRPKALTRGADDVVCRHQFCPT